MNKLVKLIFVLGFFVFGFWVSASNVQKSFLETIVDEKISIEQKFDSTYLEIYEIFQNLVGVYLTSLDYQGLICLGVLDDVKLLNQIQNDTKNLKLGFLNAYSVLYSEALDLQQKKRILDETNVSLFVQGTSYESEKERILQNLENLSTSQKNLATQFKNNYKNQIEKFVLDIDIYSKNNSGLLSTISNYILILSELDLKYKKMLSDLFNYQSKFAGDSSKILQKIPILKQAFAAILQESFDSTISNETKRYRILTNLGLELNQQKKYAIGLFDMKFDEEVSNFLDNWYDNKEFTKIKKDSEVFLGNYFSGSRTQCSLLLTNESFIVEANNISKKIDDFSKYLTENVSNTGFSSTGFQQNLTKRASNIIGLYKDTSKLFSSAVNQKRNTLMEQYRLEKSNTEVGNDIKQGNDISIPFGFSFKNPFKRGEYNSDIAILQKLLNSLGYYQGPIDSVYNSQTLQAVYQYQLANGLLKGYENKPETWGWMGPATRSKLNNDLMK